MGAPRWHRYLPSARQVLVVVVLVVVLTPLLLPVVASLPLLDEVHRAEVRLAAIGPEPADLDAQLDALDDLDAAARQLTDDQLGPLGAMLAGERRRAARAAWLAAVARDVLGPAHLHVAERLRVGGDFLGQRDRLAAYLMIAGRGPRDRRARDALGPLVVERLAAHSHRSAAKLRNWVDELLDPEKDRLAGVPLAVDEALVAEVRTDLAGRPLADKIRWMTIAWVESARYGGDDALQYPPFELARILDAKPSFAGVLAHRSATPVVVPGSLTGWGRTGVLARMERLEKDFAENAWVVPLRPEEQGEKLAAAEKAAIDAVNAQQKEAWTAFLSDIVVPTVRAAGEADRILDALADREGPYLLLLREIDAATSRLIWDPKVLGPGTRRGTPHYFPCGGVSGGMHTNGGPCKPRSYSPTEDEERGEAWWAQRSGRATPPLADLLGGMVTLGPRRDGPRTETVLERWAPRVSFLRRALLHEVEASREGEPEHGRAMVAKARAEGREATERDLANFDDLTRRIWGPLLLAPFDLGSSRSR
jgi:hypothetical protein